MIDDLRRDYARGYLLVTGDGVPDDVFRRAAALAPEDKRRALFGEVDVNLDRWRRDAAGLWHGPDRDTPPTPYRVNPSRGELLSTAKSAAAATGQSSSAYVAAGAAAAAALSDQELAEELAASRRWERWYRNPEAWRERWDLRTLYIGRALRD